MKNKLETAYGAKMFDIGAGLGFSCDHEEYQGMHWHGDDLSYYELVDPDTKQPIPITNGARGEMLMTNLDADGLVAVRESAGDVHEVFTEPCACGLSGFRYKVVGRADDMLKVKGIMVYPSHIKGVINDFVPRVTGEMRIILDERPPRVVPPLKIRVEHAAGISGGQLDALANEISDAMSKRLKINPQIIWAEPGSLERSMYKGKVFEKTYERKWRSNNMRDVYIVGVGMTRFFKWLERGIKDLTRESVTEALNDAGLQKEQIEAAWFANSTWGFFERQHQMRGQVALGSLVCTGSLSAIRKEPAAADHRRLHGAWLAVASGAYECAMAVGSEKLYNENKAKSFGAIATGTDVENDESMTDAWIKRLNDLGIATSAEDVVDQNNLTRSPMMDIYAYMIRWHMKAYGSTQHQLALITSKNHWHGSMNPKAQYQKEMTVEEVLAGKPILYPLTAPMCAPLGDGSAAAILCSADFLKRMKSPRPVKILASVYGSNSPRCFDEPDKGY